MVITEVLQSQGCSQAGVLQAHAALPSEPLPRQAQLGPILCRAPPACQQHRSVLASCQPHVILHGADVVHS